MIRQYELIDKVKAYDPNIDEDALNRAYVFAMKMHGTQKRESGDPYFSHPLEVAGILSDMKLDCATIITALLHDTVEDTAASLDDIYKHFGEEIGKLVDGVTKLSRIELQSDQTKQAENFRKLVLAMSNDLRVLLVKLADRLHNMRTLHYCKSEEKRKRVSRETLDIYAPLAERIGIHHIKDELEDLAFKEINADARESIIARLDYLEHEGGRSIVEKIIDHLSKLIDTEIKDAKVYGRVKAPYSIWRKMHHKNISIEQLADIMAFRIIVDRPTQCYQALGVIHGQYRVIPGRFKDYISTPKPNNYQSLHTTVIGPEQQRIEIQIRTEKMHKVAELGVAAHWQYKQGEGSSTQTEYRWLRSLLEIIEHAAGPEEFLEHTKLEMFQDQVFCFTPAGDLISLPRGATPIDFAYAIHSEVGNHCVGAKINSKMVPLRTVLNNGDQVDITTSKAQSPSPTWERFVVTGKARANIRRYMRTQQREQYIDLGRSILQKTFLHEDVEFNDKALERSFKKLGVASVKDLYAAVGEGMHTSFDVLRACYPSKQEPISDNLETIRKITPRKEQKSAISIRGLIPGMAIHYAGCCHPLPGDKIVGIVITGRGVTIHTYDCDNLNQYAEEPERWLDVSWEQEMNQESHVGRLHVIVNNQSGALANLTTVISKNHANIVNLKITNRSEEFYDFLVDLEVKDSDHLASIIATLRASSFINLVERAR